MSGRRRGIAVRELADRGVTLVCPEGTELYWSDADALRDVLAMVRRQGQHAVLDLAGIVYLDSAVLGALVGAHRRAQEAGLLVVLAGACGQPRRFLETTQLDRLLELAAGVAAGVARCEPRSGAKRPLSDLRPAGGEFARPARPRTARTGSERQG